MTAPLYNLTDTWNAGGTTFNAILMNIADTAHAAGSKLLNFQYGGTSVFVVNAPAAGSLSGANIGIPNYNAGQYDYVYGNGSGICLGVGNANGPFTADVASMNASGTVALSLASAAIIGFRPSGQADTGPAWDLILTRDAAGVFSQRNGTNPQTQRVYNTFTDASNYERGIFGWTSNVLWIGTEKAGTGADRDIMINTSSSTGVIQLGMGGSAQLNISSNGAVWSSSIRPFTWGDAGICRGAAKVMQITDGTLGATNTNGWMQWGGQARVTSDFTVSASTTLVNITGLTVNVQAGRTYSFEASINYTCTAAGGVKAAIAGTCTATNIIYDGWAMDVNVIKGNAQATALAGAVANSVTAGTAGHIIIRGTITVNAAGTLTVQLAQNTASGTTVAKRGSWFMVQDMP